MEKKPASFQDLLRELRDEGRPITVDTGRTLFYEGGKYFEQLPDGRKEISLEEAQGYLRIMVARWRRERRAQRKEERV